MSNENLNDLGTGKDELETARINKNKEHETRARIDKAVLKVVKEILIDLMEFDKATPIMPQEAFDVAQKHYRKYLEKSKN